MEIHSAQSQTQTKVQNDAVVILAAVQPSNSAKQADDVSPSASAA
jgi:hypothetical protein